MSAPIRPEISRMGMNPLGEIAQLAWKVGGVTPLYFGEGDLGTPDFISAAAKRALDDGKTFYTFANGIPELRAALKTYTDRLYGVDIAPERITVPGSAMLAITITLQCLMETGDNIVIVTPMWTNIILAAAAAGIEARFAPLTKDESGRWHFDLETVAAKCDARTKAIFVASPGNPTGWVMRRAEQENLLAFAREQGIAIIADEVYARLIHDSDVAPSFLEIAGDEDPVFVINSFSKNWAMTGWRIGWMIAPESLFTPLQTLCGIANTGATTFAQYGALAALTDPRGEAFIEMLRERCRRGRALVEKSVLQSNRAKPLRVEGAFYGYLEIDGVTDSVALAKRLVTEAKVGVAPGGAFGPGNDSFIRICFANDEKILAPALERLFAAL
ncbi:MAG TPA: aminotransferase class I/II-fold pyridoxal phosphate-dependent enzyme [Alphaproteobacteria bacterium]|nr:aminotransferase class I/II-fold pyridoxal phosphate-dependent enzyme [Alphaproteobacteria bacterium]